MKQDPRVLVARRLPARWPIFQTLSVVTAISHFEASDTVKYVVVAFLTAWWILIASLKIFQRPIDPFDLER